MQLATKYFRTDHPENAEKAKLETDLGVADANLEVEAVVPGIEGNSIRVSCVDPGEELSNLSAEYANNHLIIYPETNDTPVSATAVVGTGNGVVTTTVVAAGEDGNDYSIDFRLADGVDEELSAALVGEVIEVDLGTTDSEQAEAEIGEVGGIVTITVTAPGEAGNDYRVVVDDSLAEVRSLSASLVGNLLTINLETELSGEDIVLDDSVNIPATIKGVIDGIGSTPFTVGTDGTDPINQAYDVEFTDGDDGGGLDEAKNTAINVATEIDGIGELFTSVHGGTGGDPVEVQEIQFSGGTEYSPISTAAEIVTEVEGIDDIDDVLEIDFVGDDGSGVTPYFSETLSDGQYATTSPEALAFVVADGFWVCAHPVTKRELDGWVKYVEDV